MSELVSILIPAYNAEKYLKDTINSALSQTWPNKEIIIVDDGSCDKTLQIARTFESKRVKVITQPNAGSCRSRNKALQLAQGEYIQWLDADDQLAPDKISCQMARNHTIRDTKVLYCSAWGTFYHRIDKTKYQPSPIWKSMTPVEWFIKSSEGQYWMQTSSWLVSRVLTEAAGPWEERLESINDDGEYFARVVARSRFVEFVPESRCYYRIYHPGSATYFRKRSERALRSWDLSVNLIVDHLLLLENSEESRKAAIRNLHSIISRLYPYSNMAGVKDLIEADYKRIINLGGERQDAKETLKFWVARRVLGLKCARILRDLVWWARFSARREWDELF